MRWLSRWADWPLRWKGLAVVAIPLLPILLSIVVLVTGLIAQRDVQGWRAHSLEIKADIEETQRLLVQAQTSVRGYLLTATGSWLDPYKQARAALPLKLAHLQASVADNPVQLMGVAQLRQSVNAWLALAQQEAGLRAPTPGSPTLVSLIEQGKALMDNAVAQIDTLRAREDALLRDRSQRATRTARWLAYATLISLPIGFIGGVPAALLLARGIARRVDAVRRNADRLITGQLFEPVAGQDEVGVLGQRLAEVSRLLASRDAEIRDRVRDLQILNEELEAFTYSVSHDLRAPLRHIAGFGELLRERAGGALDATSQRYLDTMGQSAGTMGQLIDDLLTLSRVGRSELHHAPVPISELVHEVIAELEPDINGRRVEWRVTPLPTVSGDRALIKVVLTNLLSNAVKYTRPRPAAVVEVGTLEGRSGEQVFFVRDNGVGFDMRFGDRLFGVFQRLHRAEEFEGTGIGLATVRRIVNRHGGRAWAEGEVDRGATLFIALPAVREAAAA